MIELLLRLVVLTLFVASVTAPKATQAVYDAVAAGESIGKRKPVYDCSLRRRRH